MSATFARRMAAGVVALVCVAAVPVQALAYTDPVTHWEWNQVQDLQTAISQGFRLATAQEFTSLVEHAGYSLYSPSAPGQGQDYLGAHGTPGVADQALLGFQPNTGFPVGAGWARMFSLSKLQSDDGTGIVYAGLSTEDGRVLLPCDTDSSGLCATTGYTFMAGVGSEAYFRASTFWGPAVSEMEWYGPLSQRSSYTVVRAVPEPASIALLLAGVGVVAVMRRRRI